MARYNSQSINIFWQSWWLTIDSLKIFEKWFNNRLNCHTKLPVNYPTPSNDALLRCFKLETTFKLVCR